MVEVGQRRCCYGNQNPEGLPMSNHLSYGNGYRHSNYSNPPF
jgi:hypothetical protein